MIAKIKNSWTQKIVFETFEIAKNEIQDLVWDKAIITPTVFAQIIKSYSQGRLLMLDANEDLIEGILSVEYFTLDENGNESAIPTTDEVDKNLVELNLSYSKMRREKQMV